jgi:hypothetical protein
MNLPGNTDRIAIVGATGSGKTHAAMWQLSRRDFDKKPWVILDYKGDELLNSIQHAQHISLEHDAPTAPGIYIVHPNPGEESEVEAFLWKLWQSENVGIYIDEGVMIGNGNDAYRACLTQGRSKHIPMVVLCQRPVWIDQFTFSESDFFQVFRLGWLKDVKKMEEFIPYDLERRLPEHYSYYYDVKANEMVIMAAVPDHNAILDTFDLKLSRLLKVV